LLIVWAGVACWGRLMSLLKALTDIWQDADHPFFICSQNRLKFSDISSQFHIDLSLIKAGDVVSIIGDFDPLTILTFLRLIDMDVVVVPLTADTAHMHEYFFESALVDVVVNGDKVIRRKHAETHRLIDILRRKRRPGLVLFSTGTTGRPKAILHDFTKFLKRFNTPRPTLTTINFLLFDHIGGINTLLHTLFNKGVVVVPEARTVDSVLDVCQKYSVEVLPTTPTFLRMMLMSGVIPEKIPPSMKIITYGTERMDQPTLDELCYLLPNIDFRQTFGMSELGIVRVKSKARNSLFMKVGGEGIDTKVINNVLWIRSKSRMLGYLNASSPFDEDGWYNTQDVVDEENGYYKVVGRTDDVINVGGLKFMASEVEHVALSYPNISLVKAYSKNNPFTGQHVELLLQPVANKAIDKNSFKVFLEKNLQSHMVPKRIIIKDIDIGHRFKRA
jgi:long-chain acyl-CoA synthetase